MIRVLYACEKTNSFRPEPWNWSTDPFPAFRGAGQRYNAFLAVANGFTPWFSSFDLADNTAISDDFCKIITTKKGTRLLVPCSEKEDEKILLITARGGFRGGFGAIEAVGGEILWQNGMSMHCCPVAHIVARITEPDGYIRTETGRRCSHGDTEVYSWKGGYFRMDTEEYDAAAELGNLFSEHNTMQSDLEKCQAKRAEQAASRKAKSKFLPRLEAVNSTLKECGGDMFDLSGNTFFTERGYAGAIIRHLYKEETVKEAGEKAEKALADRAQREACAEWEPQFKEATKEYAFTEGKDPWGDQQPKYYANGVSVWGVAKDHFVYYEHSAEGLAQFVQDLPIYEEEYQSKQRAKAKAEAERIAKQKAEEAERLAREAAAEKLAKAEAEAKELGLPSDIRIWHRNGRTNAGKAWVIAQNGMERECDSVDTMACGSSSKRYHQNYEGDHVWNQILPGELVIKWSKACTAAEHVCEVVYRPEAISEAQLERVVEIQQEIEEEWSGLTGLASGKESPSIGDGWLGVLV